jgi:hypothetical protein
MSIEWKNPLNRMHQPKTDKRASARPPSSHTSSAAQIVEDKLPQPESGAICRLPILKHMYDQFSSIIELCVVEAFTLYSPPQTHVVDMSDFFPAKSGQQTPESASLSKKGSQTTECAKSPARPLKTSDDDKWRVGLHELNPQLGGRFDGVKLFCAKDAIENGADGEFRWVMVVSECVDC